MVFVNGHIGYKGMLGKHHSEKTIQKLKSSHLGQHYSPQTEFKKGLIPWCKGKKNPWLTKRNLENNPMKNQEIKKKVSEANIGKHYSLQTEFKKGSKINLGRKRPDMLGNKFRLNKPHSEKWKEMRLHQILPRKDTSIERKVQNELSSREIGFYKHYSVIGQPDIAFPDKKIAIFCDGDYWHKCPSCGFGNGREKDARINEQLRNQGWLVLRYWEHEININVEGIVDEIEDVILKQGAQYAYQ